MLDAFIIHALVAGIIVSIITGSIGCFVVWRKMAYFGDSLSHSALLGISIGLASGVNPDTTTIITCSIFAILLLILQRLKFLSNDTLLGILAHAGLSIGMVTISLLDQVVNIESYLFGDILTVKVNEIGIIACCAIFILGVLYFSWSSLILMTISEDIAQSENVNISFYQITLMLMMALIVAISIKIVGILLITSMLIIPAATARYFSRSPEMMAIMASLFASLAVVIGVFSSVHFDLPTGPTIVTSSTALFVTALMISKVIHNIIVPRLS